MTLDGFRDLLLTADPNATHYRAATEGNYTTWTEFGKSLIAGHWYWKVQVDRYTKDENDSIASAIEVALEGADIPTEYLRDYEQDTGYIHHIYDCQFLT